VAPELVREKGTDCLLEALEDGVQGGRSRLKYWHC